MAERRHTIIRNEADPRAVEWLLIAERVALGAVITLAILNLGVSFLPPAQDLTHTAWRLMSGEAVLFALMSALSLLLLEPNRSDRLEWTGWVMAALVLLICGIIAILRVAHPPADLGRISTDLEHFWLSNARISLQAATGFAVLGLAMMFLRAHSRTMVLMADIATGALVTAVLILVTEQMIGLSGVFGQAEDTSHSFQSMLCLFLLMTVTFCRRARHGIFAIFLGSGTGSRMARSLSPLLLVAPYFREWARARLIGGKTTPPLVTALLATMVVLIAISILIYMAGRINGMEIEIHTLSLRDELTGLNNLRGFRLLAEQALRMAHRSGRPFSVLYIDLDDLKQINDHLGHSAGSQCIADASGILRTVFREADVLGRIGGDEFAVAGEFTDLGITQATRRLERAVADWNAGHGRTITISLSFGAAIATAGAKDTLDALLANADRAMYENKRRKKGLTPEAKLLRIQG